PLWIWDAVAPGRIYSRPCALSSVRTSRPGGTTMSASRISRRRFLTLTGAVAGAVTLHRPLHAQAKTVKVGVVSPISGALAEVGGDCRLGAQLAAETINAAGGIKSMGGAKIELLLADSETKPEVARSEAERLIGAGAQLLTGGFHS